MKICFILNSIFSLGGVQRVVTVIANELSKENQVEILCISDQHFNNRKIYNLNENISVIVNNSLLDKNFFTNKYSKVIRKLNNKTNLFKNYKYVDILTKAYIPNEIQKRFINFINTNNYDVVIGVEGKYSVLLGCIADKVKAKVIGWQHNSYDAYLHTKNQYCWKQDNLFKKHLNKLDYCIVLTNDDKEKYYQNLNVKCTTIYNPLSFTSKEKCKLDRKNVLFVGRLLKEQKGLDLLLDIFKKIAEERSDWNLVIVGEGEDKEYLLERIKQLNLQNNVEVKPFSKNVQEYYLSSSIFVSTSRWEGFGLVVTEAMECGLPVIAFENTGPKEIINNSNENGILVRCGDKEEFVGKLLSLINNKDTLNKISKESIKRAKDFSIENISNEWIKIINK